ncbi:hypothetical protein KEM52_004685 [Ascosphaera acerosa]|nr:hypothetical protein KEM52_004685 [Ascosphaera acerosa]
MPTYPPYSRGTLGFRQPSHERPQYQHLLAQANSMHGITQSMPASFHLRSPSRPQMRCPEGFEEVSQNHLRYNPHHGETPAPAPQPLSVPDTDALARQVGALRLHEHDTAEHNAHARNSQGRRIGESGGARHPGRDFRAPPRGMLRNEAEDLRAQADERERNRLRKLQSAKSRGWDARKTEDGLDARGDDRNDPERIALRQGPDRVAEDRARRARLLRQGTASDHDDEPGVVYPEPGRLEPIDFGDEATNAARQGQAASGQQPQHQESQSGGNGELPPLPELIEPGVSWADIMDEEDWK